MCQSGVVVWVVEKSSNVARLWPGAGGRPIMPTALSAGQTEPARSVNRITAVFARTIGSALLANRLWARASSPVHPPARRRHRFAVWLMPGLIGLLVCTGALSLGGGGNSAGHSSLVFFATGSAPSQMGSSNASSAQILQTATVAAPTTAPTTAPTAAATTTVAPSPPGPAPSSTRFPTWLAAVVLLVLLAVVAIAATSAARGPRHTHRPPYPTA